MEGEGSDRVPFNAKHQPPQGGKKTTSGGRVMHRRAAGPADSAERPVDTIEKQVPAAKTAPAGSQARQTRPLPPATPGGGVAVRRPPRPSGLSRLAAGLGQLLYTLGFSGEYVIRRICRVIKEAGILIGQLLGFLLVQLARGIVAVVRGFGRWLIAPFTRFNRRMRQLRRLREREHRRAKAAGQTPAGNAYAGAGARHALALLGHIAVYVLPLAAFVALGITIYTVMNMQYALAVEVNGQVLGHVADKSVVENAKSLLRGRIRLAADQELSDWQFNPDYSIGRALQFTTAQQLVNEILLNSTEADLNLVQATGLYIDGELYAVTTEGEQLAAYLQNKLNSANALAQTDAEVSFVKDVVCQPGDEDVFLGSTVVPYDTLLQRLEAVADPEETYRANGEESLSTIAYNHALTLETLQNRNPDYAEMPDDFVPEAGTVFLIEREEPFLQVQTSIRVRSTETIPYKTVEQETDKRQKGRRQTVQKGADGLQEVWDDLYYVDGELERSVRVDSMTLVLTPATPEIIEVGTYDFATANITGDYNEVYMFPAPTSTWSYRGFGSHRGLDLNGPIGIPIVASNAGVVIYAGDHYSWGLNIVIEHPDGIKTRYAHCSAMYVNVGDVVKQGDVIAAMGSTGNSSGSHLHFEVLVNDVPVDPMNYVTLPEGHDASRWYRG
ncbi:MAG: peptidoglycan DD-metalloendopeptidase family protein [Ruminococcaceae bacterium]|nr:peptidoglycan DD-metalloendopeptidase family protein [Oscillospiraceae bacterium]